jgi:hypothetical protein
MLLCNGGFPNVCISAGYNNRNRHHGHLALGTRPNSVRDVPEVDLVNIFGIFFARKFCKGVARPVPHSHVRCGKDSWRCSRGRPNGRLENSQIVFGTSPKSTLLIFLAFFLPESFA